MSFEVELARVSPGVAALIVASINQYRIKRLSERIEAMTEG